MEIKIPKYLAKYTGGYITLHSKPGKVINIFSEIQEKYPRLGSRIFNTNNTINPYFKLFLIDGKEKRLLNLFEKEKGITTDYDLNITEKQELELISNIAGG